MQSSNILIRPQRLFLAAVASRLRVCVICLDRFLSEGNFLVSFPFFFFLDIEYEMVAEGYKRRCACFLLFLVAIQSIR